MDNQELAQAIFAEPERELSEQVQNILSGKHQVTIENLISVCNTTTLAQQRLINNSRLCGDNIISLALKNDCEELFKCVVGALAARSQTYKPLNKEIVYKFKRKHHFTWIANLEERELKWMLRSCIEAPSYSTFVYKVVREMSEIGRDLNMFLTEYSPLAHIIYRGETGTYQNLMRTELSGLKTLDGEPLIFQVVECEGNHTFHQDIQSRIELWDLLITKEDLIHGQYFGTNLFTRAIEMHDLPLVDYLIEQYPETVCKLESNELPLIVAIKCGSYEIAERLIRGGFSSTERNKRGLTPLQAAFYSDCACMTELLLRHALDKDIFTMDNLCRAMSAGRWWLAKKIFEGIMINCDLAEIFGENNRSCSALEVQIDIMTTRYALGEGQKKPEQNMLALYTWKWCTTRLTLDILDTDGRDWWYLSCVTLHRHPGIAIDAGPKV